MIPIFKPTLGAEELEAVKGCFDTGWVGIGPKTAEFEQQFAKYLGTKFAVGMNSATAALHLSLAVYGINSGEVIVPAITFVSTAHAVVYNNAKPIFADVQQDTLQMDPEEVRKKITKKTKAIIPVHYAGHPVDMDPILELAEKHNLIVIEDCANATGALYKNKKVGTLGHMGCFSFHAIKNMTTGEGGMITTNDESKIQKLHRLRWVGIDKDTWKRSQDPSKYSWYYEIPELGYKYHMSDINAAIGIVQLKKVDALNKKRREIVNIYNKSFKNLDWLQQPIEKEYVKHSWWIYAVRVENRDDFMKHLASKGVATGVHFMPIHLHPYYKKICPEASCPVAEREWKKLVTLPLYPSLSKEQIDTVIEAVKSFKP